MYWPRGRVWGGSSALNAMVYIRGHAHDYDRWQREGAEGWEYDRCLPYFKKAQCHELGEDTYRGGNGPLNVSQGLYTTFYPSGGRGICLSCCFCAFCSTSGNYILVLIVCRWSVWSFVQRVYRSWSASWLSLHSWCKWLPTGRRRSIWYDSP